jgi:hypothetical protein
VRCKANNSRYPNPLLGVAATLISKMSVEETSLDTFLRAKVHNELVAIAHEYEFHKQTIVQITACLGTLYVNSGPKIIRYSENAGRHAKILMQTLKHSQDDLNEILNILIALRSLVKLSIEMPAGTTFTERHGHLTARYHILRDLKEDGFDVRYLFVTTFHSLATIRPSPILIHLFVVSIIIERIGEFCTWCGGWCTEISGRL